ASAFHSLPSGATAYFVNLSGPAVDRDGPTRVDVNSTLESPAASTAKLPVMITVWRQVNDGKRKMNDTVTVTKDKVVGGTGILQGQVGSTHTIEDLLEITLLNSDNTGANLLIDAAGGLDQVNATMKSLGLTHTHIGRRFMDTDAQKRGLDNT